jgi:pimeloyl-ACP methyl ester carboxylesterase
MLMTDTLLTAPNRTVEAANGVRYAYRRLGAAAYPPLVLLQHFRGNLDNWDPALIDALASRRDVIMFDNAGVGGSTGITPRTVTAMAHDAMRFLDALHLPEIDLLGFSPGGVRRPGAHPDPGAARPPPRPRGHGPAGWPGHAWLRRRCLVSATRDEPGAEDLLALFFERSESSVAAGWKFVERIFVRTEDRDSPTTLATRDAQLDAIHTWGIPEPSKLDRLAGITQPVLVANGDNDRMVPTRNTHLLADRLPDAELRIYPDAGHGFLFQYPDDFAAAVHTFLA